MIAVDSVRKVSIRNHYQLGTLFYRLLWGPHIHHGIWEGNESAYLAQCRLTDTLADFAHVHQGSRMLDVGCGMGGSSIRLAKLRSCHATGITISSLQSRWASCSAFFTGVGSRTRFLTQDAETAEFPPESFDVIWSVECTEHLFDKASFFKRASQWLKPGGRLAIVVWFEGANPSLPNHRQRVEEVCQKFVCPSLATRQEYAQWITDAGLKVIDHVDWSEQAARTWEICKSRVSKSGVKYLARILDKEQVAFLDGFDTLIDAYRSGDMEYGALIAEKPIGG
jgi:tocopherol O-methyltransferase